MFAHRDELYKSQLLGLVIACFFGLFLLAGCGGDSSDSPSSGSTSGSTTSDADVSEADPEDVKVIEAWSDALREGDVEAAAGYFAIPSTTENGFVAKIESTEDAIKFNDSLPCGAEVISARTQGELTTATFSLTERPGGDCGKGTGGTASTSFDIVDGKIVDWRRIDEPPDPGGGSSADSPV